MNKRNQDAYLSRFKNEQNLETPLVYGFTKQYCVDKILIVEKQNIHTKKDFLYENNFSGNHLEFTFPIKGNFEFEINQKYMHAKSSLDLFSLSAFEHKSSRIFAKKGEDIKQLSVKLNPDLYFKNFDLTKELTKEETNLYKVSAQDEDISGIVQKLYNTEATDIISKLEIRSLVYELIDLSVNRIIANKPYHKCINRNDLIIIRNIKKYIDNNFLKKLTLSAISSFSYSNEFKIKKQYKEVYGETIFETIRKKRMNYAVELISQNKHSLSEIAYICGYESYPSFYKTFKKYFSFSPSEI